MSSSQHSSGHPTRSAKNVRRAVLDGAPPAKRPCGVPLVDADAATAAAAVTAATCDPLPSRPTTSPQSLIVPAPVVFSLLRDLPTELLDAVTQLLEPEDVASCWATGDAMLRAKFKHGGATTLEYTFCNLWVGRSRVAPGHLKSLTWSDDRMPEICTAANFTPHVLLPLILPHAASLVHLDLFTTPCTVDWVLMLNQQVTFPQVRGLSLRLIVPPSRRHIVVGLEPAVRRVGGPSVHETIIVTLFPHVALVTLQLSSLCVESYAPMVQLPASLTDLILSHRNAGIDFDPHYRFPSALCHVELSHCPLGPDAFQVLERLPRSLQSLGIVMHRGLPLVIGRIAPPSDPHCFFSRHFPALQELRITSTDSVPAVLWAALLSNPPLSLRHLYFQYHDATIPAWWPTMQQALLALNPQYREAAAEYETAHPRQDTALHAVPSPPPPAPWCRLFPNLVTLTCALPLAEFVHLRTCLPHLIRLDVACPASARHRHPFLEMRGDLFPSGLQQLRVDGMSAVRIVSLPTSLTHLDLAGDYEVTRTTMQGLVHLRHLSLGRLDAQIWHRIPHDEHGELTDRDTRNPPGAPAYRSCEWHTYMQQHCDQAHAWLQSLHPFHLLFSEHYGCLVPLRDMHALETLYLDLTSVPHDDQFGTFADFDVDTHVGVASILSMYRFDARLLLRLLPPQPLEAFRFQTFTDVALNEADLHRMVPTAASRHPVTLHDYAFGAVLRWHIAYHPADMRPWAFHPTDAIQDQALVDEDAPPPPAIHPDTRRSIAAIRRARRLGPIWM